MGKVVMAAPIIPKNSKQRKSLVIALTLTETFSCEVTIQGYKLL